MELAVDEINAAGGVNGKKLQLLIRDDNATPGDAVRAAEELISPILMTPCATAGVRPKANTTAAAARERLRKFFMQAPL